MSLNPNPGSDEQRDEQSAPPADVTTDSQDPTAAEGQGTPAASRAAARLDEEVLPRLSTDLNEITIINDDFRDEDEDQEDLSAEEMLQLVNTYEETLTDVAEGKILRGIVVEVRENEVLLNIGFKSEGVIPLDEFGGAEINPGDEFDVFLEKLENQDGLVALSKERADFLKVWDKIKVAHENNEIVCGVVDRRIKGGLVVKLWGVDTFLPGSQVALRQVPNLEDMIGKEIECRIIKKNKRRRNVVVSRRIVLEQEREEKKKKLIAELEKGQVRRGVVKNITDFGAFVDLGGIDGLLHITDLSWGRVQHPSEVVQIGDEIDVKVLDFEQERERISLGLKQLQSYPWEDVEKKYPEGSVVRGRVVSITNYGAFVELERGVEGLIHISEMSWTRHIKHPSKVVNISDEVNVMVLKIDKENEKISLGLKQTEEDPWESLTNKYPVGTIIEGKVRNLTDFGAFVEVEEGIDGLVHISDMTPSQGAAAQGRERHRPDPGHRHAEAPHQPRHQAAHGEPLAQPGRRVPQRPHDRGHHHPYAGPRSDRRPGRRPRRLRADRSSGPADPEAGQAPVLLPGRREARPEGHQDGPREPAHRAVLE